MRRCRICFDGSFALARMLRGRPLPTDAATIAQYLEHQALVHHQHKACRAQIDSVGPNEVVLEYDYSTFHEDSSRKV